MKSIKVTATKDNYQSVIAFVEECLEAADCSMKAQMLISVAVDELFTNVVSYAYPNGEGDFMLELDIADGKAKLSFIDWGEAFDPLSIGEPDITSDSERRKIGGLGIHIVKKSMDNVYYCNRDGKNILTIEKEI